MNQKRILQLVLAIAIAAIGWWQSRAPTPSPSVAPSIQAPSPSVGTLPAVVPNASFDYFVVSYSWSPSYCAMNPNDQRQCGGKGYGFVLHGLWPQKSSGGFPENCPLTARPSKAAVERALAFMPSEKLIDHEWKKHGTCTGLSGDDYLALSDKAFAALNIPAAFNSPSSARELSAKAILSEFGRANPGLPEGSLVVKCSGTELQEVRLCVNTQLKPVTCGKGVRNQCRQGDIQVRSVR
jgi:ribonuclease T2